MTRAHAIAKAADRRLWLAAIVRAAGRCLTVAAGAGVALVATDRLLGMEVPFWTLVATPVLAGVIATGLVGARERRRAGEASIVLDHALGLRDRVSSALALERAASNGEAHDPFLALARDAADQAAAGASVRRAIPVRFDNWWLAAPVAISALVALAALLPAYDVLGARERRIERVALEERREDARTAIEQARQALREATAEAAPDGASPEQLAALEQLDRELAQGRVSPDDARTQAASRLGDLAQNLEDRAEREDRTLDALGERFSSLDQRVSEQSRVRPLEHALRQGDMGAAAEALERLRRDLAPGSGLTDAEREGLARDLSNLARAIEEAGAREPTNDEPSSPRKEEAFDELRERGLPSDLARDLADSPNADELRDALEDRGMAPEQADRLARQIAEENRRREGEAQAERDARDLAEALDRAAENARHPETLNPEEPPQPSRPSQSPESPESAGRDDQRTPPEDRERDPSDRRDRGDGTRPQQRGPAQDAGVREGEERRADDERGRSRDDAQRPDSTPQPGTQQDQNAREGGEGASPADRPAQPGAQQSERDAQGQGAGQESQRRGGANADRESQTDAPAEGFDDNAAPGERSSQGNPSDGAGRALDTIRRIAERQQNASQSREQAQRLREQAERMLEDLSPEEREEMRRLAEQIARERGAPGALREDFSTARTETVDARPRDQSPASDAQGRVIAEWLTRGEPTRDGASGRVDAQRRIAQAAEGAQRAIEEQQTPPRYADLIRRYFRRLPDAVERAAPAPDAPDVAPPAPPSQGSGG